jgi:hypothetical protein
MGGMGLTSYGQIAYECSSSTDPNAPDQRTRTEEYNQNLIKQLPDALQSHLSITKRAGATAWLRPCTSCSRPQAFALALKHRIRHFGNVTLRTRCNACETELDQRLRRRRWRARSAQHTCAHARSPALAAKRSAAQRTSHALHLRRSLSSSQNSSMIRSPRDTGATTAGAVRWNLPCPNLLCFHPLLLVFRFVLRAGACGTPTPLLKPPAKTPLVRTPFSISRLRLPS